MRFQPQTWSELECQSPGCNRGWCSWNGVNIVRKVKEVKSGARVSIEDRWGGSGILFEQYIEN